MKIHLIGDTHFNHEKIIEFENRPPNFKDIIIKNWNKLVSPDDLVIHLGDVIFKHPSELTAIMGRLNGRKILTLGNHDHQSYQWYMQHGFDFACDLFYWGRILFSHMPQIPLPPYDITLNIHAHLHRNGHRWKEYAENEYFIKNASQYHLIQIEDNLSPVTLESVIERNGYRETRNETII